MLFGRGSLAKLLVLLTVFVVGNVLAAAPQLYRRAAYEGPVHGDPDDLLLLGGYGFAVDDTVVYRAVADTTGSPPVPSRLPTHSDGDFGVAPIVSSADVPYSLTVKLPQIIRADQAYALWVRTVHGEWSEAVEINDARPLWLSPAYVYASGMPAFLPRELKIAGRNLNPSPGQSMQIKLIGPQRFTAAALRDPQSSDTLNRYVARLQLPAHLAPGSYRIQVNRDGRSWVDLEGQLLRVNPDPPPPAKFFVSDSRFGGCRPDDGADDTTCILRAISAAKRAGGGAIYFGPGTWDLIDGGQAGLAAGEGIVVPAGVQLQGAGSTVTRIRRHAAWNAQVATAAFTLLGHTLVTGLTFRDLQVYEPNDRAGPFLQLGEDFQRAASVPPTTADAAAVTDTIITRNIFDKPMVAIASGGLPINELFVTYNTFGAFNSALELSGDPFNMAQKYRLDDSVIDYNIFKPGSKLDLIQKTGTIASEMGAGHRVDFSGNDADGAATDYLYGADDAKGWRAAFFWNTNNNVEELLVSRNTATCTGDKIGDGEAFAFDNNTNTFAFGSAPTVVDAGAASVGVSAPLAARQNTRDVPVASYYIGHWVQIVSGPGVGEARKIIGYTTDSLTRVTTFQVTPEWDVVPIIGRSRIAVGREYWQLYAVDNLVDNRQPLCQKSNRSRTGAGLIVMWAQSADSAIAGNRQYDSDGIFVQQVYAPPEHPCTDCTMQSYFHSFLEIRSNVVDGEYAWVTDCSASGITAGVGAAPWGDAIPPTVGFGVSISHNTIRHADGLRGGAIGQMDSWSAGPEPHRWPLSDNMLIYHNSIADIDGPRALSQCGSSRPRIGIAFPEPGIAWRTVLYANSCKNVATPIGSGGIDTIKVCPSPVADSCECAGATN
jgi:hypothetical protein